MKKQFRFSIIEMMVVIAIILILMSMVMPILQVVRDKANKTKTLAAAKSIGLIMVAYAEDDLKSFKMPYPLARGQEKPWGSSAACWSTTVAEMLFAQKYMKLGDETQLKSAGSTAQGYVPMYLNDATPSLNKFWGAKTECDFQIFCDKGLTSNVSGKVVLVATYDNDTFADCQFDHSGWVVFYADKTVGFLKRKNENDYSTTATSLDTVDLAAMAAVVPIAVPRKTIVAPETVTGCWGKGGGSTELMGKKDTDPVMKALVR